jgi:hypothetical protein
MTKHTLDHIPKIDWNSDLSRETATKPNFINIHQVSVFIGVTDRTVKNWVKRGLMPPRSQFSRSQLFFRPDIEFLIAQIQRNIALRGRNV